MSNQVEVTIVPAQQAAVEVESASIPTVVELNVPALQQPTAAVRIDAATTAIVYVGVASYGAAESAAVWTITRSTFSAAGVLTATATATNATWTGRASATYS